jgi:50S ribosomal protein L16 3-hydroxylase
MQERLPGGMAASEFLRRHWQREPLLVRNALPGLGAGPGKRKLFTLAGRSDVEARLVSRRNGRWNVWHGPLGRNQLARQPGRSWTLLVHGVNHHCTDVEQLLRRFSFLPQARLDDVMVSYAAPGGGVGAHYDRYDVFLVQGSGRRLWRLERKRRFAEVRGAPLRLIADFAPQEEYLLEPGDMLYCRRDGDTTALRSNHRSPTRSDFAHRALQSSRLHCSTICRIAVLRRASTAIPACASRAVPGRSVPQMLRFAEDAVRAVRWTRAQAHACLARFLTTTEAARRVRGGRLARARARASWPSCVPAQFASTQDQLLYYGRRFFINGEEVRPQRTQERARSPALPIAGRPAGRALARSGAGDLLYGWYQDGYLDLERAT